MTKEIKNILVELNNVSKLADGAIDDSVKQFNQGEEWAFAYALKELLKDSELSLRYDNKWVID